MKEKLLVCDAVQSGRNFSGISEERIDSMRKFCLLGVFFRPEDAKNYPAKFRWVSTRLRGVTSKKKVLHSLILCKFIKSQLIISSTVHDRV